MYIPFDRNQQTYAHSPFLCYGLSKQFSVSMVKTSETFFQRNTFSNKINKKISYFFCCYENGENIFNKILIK